MYIYDENTGQWLDLRKTPAYRRKKGLVRDAWILLSVLMLTMPLALVLISALLGAFLSFTFLDETWD